MQLIMQLSWRGIGDHMKFLLVADDFSGSNDTGVQLKRKGLNTVVTLGTCIDDTNSCVIDTESRQLDEEFAYGIVKKRLENVDFSNYDYVIKKIDSTLRGNIVAEIRAIDETYNSDLIAFIPAYPDLRRTTIDGIHYIDDVRILESEFAKDPIKPVLEDNIYKMLRDSFKERIQHISLKDIREGKIDIDTRILSIDSETNEDMQSVVRILKEKFKKILWVGSAGIADNIISTEIHTNPSLGLVASVSKVANEQIKYASDQGVRIVTVESWDLLGGSNLREYRRKVINLLEEGHDICIVSDATTDRSKLERSIKLGESMGLSKLEINNEVQKKMAKLVKEVLRSVEVSGLYLSGGDTAIGVFKEIGAKGSNIIGEIQVGIPLMEVIGGDFDRLKVVTKAGAFGEPNSLYFALRKLKDKF